jgi:hypothetical protein
MPGGSAVLDKTAVIGNPIAGKIVAFGIIGPASETSLAKTQLIDWTGWDI